MCWRQPLGRRGPPCHSHRQQPHMGSRALRGGTGLSPAPAQSTVVLGPHHGCARPGLSLAELPAAPVLLVGDTQAARATTRAGAHSRSLVPVPRQEPLLTLCLGCVARLLRHGSPSGPGAARLAQLGANSFFCWGFSLLSAGSSPSPSVERSQDVHCIPVTQFLHWQHAPALVSADGGWGEAPPPALRRLQ